MSYLRGGSFVPVRRAPFIVHILPALLVLFAIGRPASAQFLCQQGQPNCNTFPPSLTITPGTETVNSRSVAVTINYCDSVGLGTNSITYNGVDRTSSFTYASAASQSGCNVHKQSVGTVTLNLGANTLSSTVNNSAPNGNLQSSTLSVTYTYVPPPSVSVTPKGGTPIALLVNTANLVDTFTVKNVESVADTVQMTCSAPPPLASCTVSSPLPLAAGASSQVLVHFSVGPQEGTVNLGLHATMKQSLGTDSGYVTLQVRGRTRGVRVMAGTGLENLNPGAAISGAFTVTNAGNFPDTVTLSTTCVGAAVTGPCTPSTTSLPIPAGASMPVTLNTTGSGTAGSTGTIRLVAALSSATGIRDSAATDITIRIARSVGVEIYAVNNESRQSPGVCLTAAIRRGVAYACGDLRIAHALPAVKTYNKARIPTLVYSSQLAHPHPVVSALITLDASKGTPDSVIGVILDGSGTVIGGPVHWPVTAFAGGATKQVAIGFEPPSTYSTNEYSWSFQAQSFYGKTPVSYTTGAFYAYVSAQNSHLGHGWTIAGVESMHIYTCRCSFLWSSGDGSAAFYQAVSGFPNLFVPAAGALTRPDTIKSDDSTGHLRFVRYAAHGVHVIFDSLGRHIQTRDRLGRVTVFKYLNATDVDSIVVPTPTGTGLVYQFQYNTTTGYLQSIVAPQTSVQGGTAQPRHVTIAINSAGDLTSITDPNNASVVQFGYGGPTDVVMTYTDRRGMLTAFTYDVARELASATLDSRSGGLNLTTTFAGAHAATIAAVMVPDSVSTTIRGARTDVVDVTRIWLDRFGPVRTRDALGYETNITRADTRWPALATRERGPTGQVIGAAYDGRGNLASETDSSIANGSGFATHSYRWDGTYDFATFIDPPLHDSLNIVYDPSTGNETSEQDASGAISQTTIGYDPTLKLVNSVTAPGTPASQIQYDGLGNLAAVRSPRGYWTLYQADSLGRDTTILEPVNPNDTLPTPGSYGRTRSSVQYDAVNRAIVKQTAASGAPTATISITYDPDDRTRQVTRSSSPDAANVGALLTTYQYDTVGRTIAVTQPDNTVEHFGYDPDGNLVADTTRRGFVIKSTYDAEDRLLTRIFPQAPYTPWTHGIDSVGTGWPGDTTYGHLTVPADTDTFAYDGRGNILEADNTMARVSRTYLPSGLLASETQRVRTLAPLTQLGDFDEHAYIVTYQYDADSRRLQLTHPAQFTQAVNGSGGATLGPSVYTYNAQTGRLSSVTDPYNDQFSFSFTPRGDLASVAVGALATNRSFDADGNLSTDSLVAVGGGTIYRAAQFSNDAQGRKLSSTNSYGLRDILNATYDGIGHLTGDNTTLHTFDIAGDSVAVGANETFTIDALGNKVSDFVGVSEHNYVTGTSATNTAHSYNYQYGTGRLLSFVTNLYGSRDSTWYDASGNVQFRWQSLAGPTLPTLTDRASYYSADEKVRFTDYRTLANPNGSSSAFSVTTDEYRYDALGRRVLVHAHSSCYGFTFASDCPRNTIRRFVWDGNQVLDEVQVQDSIPEQDSAHVQLAVLDQGKGDTNPFYGRTLYTHGFDVDQPLSAVRVDYADHTIVGNGSITDTNYVLYPPFPVLGFWNAFGRNDVGSYVCLPPPATPHCSRVTESQGFMAYGVLPPTVSSAWYGSLFELQQDQDQTFYHRKRVYDPVTGQFSQEDPIGLAGGINAYGFAAGDPVNYSDPFGDSVKVNGIRSNRSVERLKRSATFRKLYDALNDAPKNKVNYVTHEAGENEVLRFSAGNNAVGFTVRYPFTPKAETEVNFAGQSDQGVDDILTDEFVHAAGDFAKEVGPRSGVPGGCEGHTSDVESQCEDIRNKISKESQSAPQSSP